MPTEPHSQLYLIQHATLGFDHLLNNSLPEVTPLANALSPRVPTLTPPRTPIGQGCLCCSLRVSVPPRRERVKLFPPSCTRPGGHGAPHLPQHPHPGRAPLRRTRRRQKVHSHVSLSSHLRLTFTSHTGQNLILNPSSPLAQSTRCDLGVRRSSRVPQKRREIAAHPS